MVIFICKVPSSFVRFQFVVYVLAIIIRLPRNAWSAKIQHFVAVVPWCVHVCLLDRTMNCAKAAEPIEMPFVMWTRVGPRNHCIRWGAGGLDSQWARRCLPNSLGGISWPIDSCEV